jgi:hypothetical protein
MIYVSTSFFLAGCLALAMKWISLNLENYPSLRVGYLFVIFVVSVCWPANKWVTRFYAMGFKVQPDSMLARSSCLGIPEPGVWWPYYTQVLVKYIAGKDYIVTILEYIRGITPLKWGTCGHQSYSAGYRWNGWNGRLKPVRTWWVHPSALRLQL